MISGTIQASPVKLCTVIVAALEVCFNGRLNLKMSKPYLTWRGHDGPQNVFDYYAETL